MSISKRKNVINDQPLSAAAKELRDANKLDSRKVLKYIGIGIFCFLLNREVIDVAPMWGIPVTSTLEVLFIFGWFYFAERNSYKRVMEIHAKTSGLDKTKVEGKK